MPIPSESSKSENRYVIDTESAAEMARLIGQDLLMTKAMGGLFPQEVDLSHVQRVLDIACGPGGWVQEVAFAHRDMEVVGIDISRPMIEYAWALTKVQGLDNATFRVMDALKPLDFADNSFDWVNTRLLCGFMPPAAWPTIIQECLRLTRPGGVIRLTETEYGISNAPTFEKFSGMFTNALKLVGQSFSPDGRHIGITPMLGRLLRDAGCRNIRKTAYVIDYSAGEEAHIAVCHDMMVVFKLVQPFLMKMGQTTEEEFDELYQRVLAEMMSNDFCAIWYYLSAWGEKPEIE